VETLNLWQLHGQNKAEVYIYAMKTKYWNKSIL